MSGFVKFASVFLPRIVVLLLAELMAALVEFCTNVFVAEDTAATLVAVVLALTLLLFLRLLITSDSNRGLETDVVIVTSVVALVATVEERRFVSMSSRSCLLSER